jgi:predicted MFS family arabinose efflux permease
VTTKRTLTITGIIQSFLAAGILQLRGVHGWAGWRYLFLIEGLITFAIGVFAALYIPSSPTQTSGGLRGKNGWFTPREETIIVNRVLRDDPTKSQMHNRQGLTLRALLKSFADFDLYPLYLIGLTNFIAPGTVGAYLTLTLRQLGFNTFQTNLLTIPSSVLGLCLNLSISFTSKALNERAFVGSIGSIWQFVLMLALVLIPDDTQRWGKYALLSLLVAYPYAHPILVSWNSANSGSVRTRSVSASLYNISVQVGGIVSSQMYRPDDAPYYHRANHRLLYIVCGNLVLWAIAKAYYVARNRSKARRWDALSPEEKDHYLSTTKDEGNRRLDFRFVH